MTYTSETIGISFSQRFAEYITSIRMRMEKSRLCRKTVTELQNLSDRDLADLGIQRDGIEALAINAAFGK